MTEDAVAILNPVAGRGLGQELAPEVLAELRQYFPQLRVETTERPGHATELAQAAAGAGVVIAVGGDGTCREVASGLIQSGRNAHLAIVPVGSGNDLLKTLGVAARPADACRTARFGRPRMIDAVRCRIADETGERTLHSVNAAGFGFDAQVVHEARRFRRLRGLPLYAAAVFLAVRDLRCPLVKIATEEQEWEQAVLLVAATNGKYYGGGMRIGPGAEPDDGLLEVCVIDAVGRVKVVRSLPRLIAGTHVTMREVTVHRTRRLALEFREPVMAQLDGDMLEIAGVPRFELAVLPRALTVRV
jgi:YegS/Rv2252/BmrU family lipid kinase